MNILNITLAQTWIFLIAFFLIIEAITPNFVTIWFAVGALAAFITSTFTANTLAQSLVFIIVTALSVLLTLPLVKKLRARKNTTPLNADRNIGRVGTVVTALHPGATGRVRLDGVEWAAKSAHALAEGESCRILAIESTLMTVEPVTVASVAP